MEQKAKTSEYSSSVGVTEKNTTGKIIRELRENKQMRQSQLAEKVGISQGGLAHWEKGRTEPSIRDLKKLADALKTDLSVLTGSPTEGLVKIQYSLGDQGKLVENKIEQLAPKISLASDQENFIMALVSSPQYQPTFWEGDILYCRERQIPLQVAKERQMFVLVELSNETKDKYICKITNSMKNTEELVLNIPNNAPVIVHEDIIKALHPIVWHHSSIE